MAPRIRPQIERTPCIDPDEGVPRRGPLGPAQRELRAPAPAQLPQRDESVDPTPPDPPPPSPPDPDVH